MCYSSYVPPSYYTDVATCCVMRILFPQHKSTYCKEVGAKFTWEFISRFKINSTSCSYIAAKNEWQSSIVQELRGIVMDATKTCLCNSYRKYLCMKNYYVLNFYFVKELIFQRSNSVQKFLSDGFLCYFWIHFLSCLKQKSGSSCLKTAAKTQKRLHKRER